MNVLLTSVGIRNILVTYFQREIKNGNGKVFAADCDRNAPALYDADKAFIVPEVSDSNYVSSIQKICIENDIGVVIALIDTELLLLAENNAAFKQRDILCVVSAPEVIDTCQDKYKMHTFLVNNGFLSPHTFIDIDHFKTALNEGIIDFPVFIKPRTGSASTGITIVDSWEELEILVKKRKEPYIIQEYLRGQEYGLDIYTDIISREVVAVFPKRKIRMRAGETDKAVSVKNPELLELGRKFAEALQVAGPCDVDCFETDKGYYISDVNPRFGGGYPLAYECGVNFMNMIMTNAEGKVNPVIIGDYVEDRYMFKYNGICIRDEPGLV